MDVVKEGSCFIAYQASFLVGQQCLHRPSDSNPEIDDCFEKRLHTFIINMIASLPANVLVDVQHEALIP